MWLMLEGYADSLGKLIEAGIPATIASISTPNDLSGVSFPDQYRAKVLSILNINEDITKPFSIQPTNVEGVSLMVREKRGQVRMEDREDSCRYKPLLEKVAEDFATNVYLCIPHQETKSPGGSPGNLHIYIWSVPPQGSTSKITLSRAFGYRLGDGVRDALLPSGKGVVVYDDDGNAVAEVFPWTIYILFDLTHQYNTNLQGVMEKILEKSLPLALTDDWNEQIKEFQKKMREKKKEEEEKRAQEFRNNQDKFRERYIKECCSRISSAVGDKKNQVVRNKKQAEELSRQLVELYRQIEQAEAEIRGLESGDTSVDKFGKEFDALSANPMIELIEVESGVVKVTTKDIIVDYNREKYNFGRFRIDMRTSGELQIWALSHSLTGRGAVVHPHVKQGEMGCLGNLGSEIAKLTARHEFSVLAQLVIAFLQSYNRDNPYSRIENFSGNRV